MWQNGLPERLLSLLRWVWWLSKGCFPPVLLFFVIVLAFCGWSLGLVVFLSRTVPPSTPDRKD